MHAHTLCRQYARSVTSCFGRCAGDGGDDDDRRCRKLWNATERGGVDRGDDCGCCGCCATNNIVSRVSSNARMSRVRVREAPAINEKSRRRRA